VPLQIAPPLRLPWLAALCLAFLPAAAIASACGPRSQLEAEGYRIGKIRVQNLEIFEPEGNEGLPPLYRLANNLHIDTRDSVIESQLLFREGEAFSERLVDETERNLRELRYIREPEVRAVGCHEGLVDLEVAVREVWTTNPGVTFERSGGSNAGGIKLEELNLLGRGKQLTFELASDADRTSYTLHWRDPGVRGSRWVHDVAFRDSNDGQGWRVEAQRPFYSLDTRWSFGTALQQDLSVEPVYRLGERVAGYERRTEFGELQYGWSEGLNNGWSRRVTAGLRREHADFDVAPDDPMPDVMPGDRLLDYPFLRFEGVQDDFETIRNRDQISRTEDQLFGLRYALEVGWSTTALGADRDALLAHAEASRGWRIGDDDSMFTDLKLTTRVEGGSIADGLLSAGLRYYHPTGPRGLFYAGLSAAAGRALDADHELTIGGDTGLRGYPLRFQAGSGTALVTVEQRFFTRYSLWKLADVGAAVFFDMGKAFGDPLLGPSEDFGLLKDVGFGLRLGSTRSALGNILHIDVAFPLDGPKSVDQVQFLVQTKRSF
jgi:outer membrane protein assembly factor BamA